MVTDTNISGRLAKHFEGFPVLEVVVLATWRLDDGVVQPVRTTLHS